MKPIPPTRVQNICLVILTVIASGATLRYFQPAVIPFILAVISFYMLKPLVEMLTERLHLPRALAVLATFGLGCGALVALGLLASTSIRELQANSEVYKTSLKGLLQSVESWPIWKSLNIELSTVFDSLEGHAMKLVASVSSKVVGGILSILSNGFLVLVFLMFLMFGETSQRKRQTGLLVDVEARVKGYLLTKAGLSILTGVLVGITLALFGVEFAFLFGFLAFLLNFIPSIGSVVATLLPLPVIMLNPALSGPSQLLAMIIPAGIQFAIGSVLEPKLMGQSLGLHPIVIVLALICFGMIWGVVGMFLAVPLTAVAKIILERKESTLPLAHLLAGRLDEVRLADG